MVPVTPPRTAGRERIGIRCVGESTGLAGSFVAAVEDDPGLVVESVGSVESVREAVSLSRPGPDCVVVTADGGTDPLPAARRLVETDPDLPVVLYVEDSSAYGAGEVLDAGVTALFEPGDGSIAEDVREAARTYRRRREARRDSAILSTLFEGIPASLFVKSADGEYVHANEPSPDPSDAESDRRVLDDGKTVDREAVYSAADRRWYLVSKAPVREGEKIVGLVGVAVDITARRERERVLQSTSRLLRAIVHASPVSIVLHDVDGTVRLWNEAAEDLFGWSADEVIGESSPPFVTESDRPEFERLCQRVDEEGAVSDVDVRWETRDGTELDLRLSAATVEPCDDDRCIVSIISDVTALRERERRLRRQHERVETFATVLAHDLRNPVQVLRGRLGTDQSDDPDAAVGRALDRIESIIDDVLSLARESPIVSDPQPVALGEAARKAWQASDRGSLTVETDATLRADPLRLRRLLAHLFRNSVEHSSTGNRTQSDDGVEDSSTGGRAEPDEDVTVQVGTLPDGFFVADDGPGIADDDRAHVREPGYSTRPGGTGYGLNVVAEIAAAHGWEVSIEESDAGGTRVEVTGVEHF